MAKSMEFIDNFTIKLAAEDLINEPGEEAFKNLALELAIHIRNNGRVPTPVQNELHVVLGLEPDAELADVFPEDRDIGNRIVVVCDDDGGRWLPIFTERDELQGMEKTNTIKVLTIREIIEQVYYEDEYEGIIINPNTDALGLRKESLGIVLACADKDYPEAG